MDIISYIQGNKANKEIKDLNQITGAGEKYKNGQLPVEDIYLTVRERIENLESISPSGIMLKEINQDIIDAHIKAVVELANTINEVDAEINQMEVIKHFDLEAEVASGSTNIQHIEEELGLLFSGNGVAEFELPENDLIKLALYAVSSKKESHLFGQTLQFSQVENIEEVDEKYSLVDPSLPGILETELIELDEAVNDVYITKDVSLLYKLETDSQQEINHLVSVKYAPLLNKIINQIEVQEEEGEPPIYEEEVVFEYGDYLNILPFDTRAFKIKISFTPEEVVEEEEEEAPPELENPELENPEEEEIESLAQQEEEELPEDSAEWIKYNLEVEDVSFSELIQADASFSFNGRVFKQGDLLSVYESESNDNRVKVKLEEGEVLHSLTASWIKR